jgi:hypothetical protein
MTSLGARSFYNLSRAPPISNCEDCSATCDLTDYPTTDYIEKHKEAYGLSWRWWFNINRKDSPQRRATVHS